MDNEKILTTADHLLNIINEEGRIELLDIAKRMNRSSSCILNLADILEENNLIDIEMSLNKTFLVSKENIENKILSKKTSNDIINYTKSKIHDTNGFSISDIKDLEEKFRKFESKIHIQTKVLLKIKQDLDERIKEQKELIDIAKDFESINKDLSEFKIDSNDNTRRGVDQIKRMNNVIVATSLNNNNQKIIENEVKDTVSYSKTVKELTESLEKCKQDLELKTNKLMKKIDNESYNSDFETACSKINKEINSVKDTIKNTISGINIFFAKV